MINSITNIILVDIVKYLISNITPIKSIIYTIATTGLYHGDFSTILNAIFL